MVPLFFRFILLLLFFYAGSGPVSAQRFRASLNGGLNLSQIDGDRLAGFNQPGFIGGAQVNAVFSERWEGSIEMLYAQQGARRNSNDDPAAAYDRIRTNMVEVPLMIQFNEWKFQIGAGLSYSRLINFKAIDVFGVDVSGQQDFRSNHVAAVVGGTVFLNEKTGLNIRWAKNFSSLRAGNGSPRWIGRSISIRGVFRI